jgi:hypothetical protein
MSALFIIPTNLRALTHPPLEKRLARLEEMSRDLVAVEQPGAAGSTASNLAAAVAVFAVVFALVLAVGLVVLQ